MPELQPLTDHEVFDGPSSLAGYAPIRAHLVTLSPDEISQLRRVTNPELLAQLQRGPSEVVRAVTQLQSEGREALALLRVRLDAVRLHLRHQDARRDADRSEGHRR